MGLASLHGYCRLSCYQSSSIIMLNCGPWQARAQVCRHGQAHSRAITVGAHRSGNRQLGREQGLEGGILGSCGVLAVGGRMRPHASWRVLAWGGWRRLYRTGDTWTHAVVDYSSPRAVISCTYLAWPSERQRPKLVSKAVHRLGVVVGVGTVHTVYIYKVGAARSAHWQGPCRSWP